MSKKNLSDLLKEEVQPTPAPEAAVEEAVKAPDSPTPSRSTRQRGPTKADLEKQVAELEAALQSATAAAAAKEAELTQTIAGLQQDLDAQQARLFELKDGLEQAEKAAQEKATQLETAIAELEEAKQVILKMSAAAPPAPQPSAPPAPIAVPARPTAPAPRPALSVKMMRRGGEKGIPEYAIRRGEQPAKTQAMLSEEEIGWVD